jgi:CheY-like chemotaxis protein
MEIAFNNMRHTEYSTERVKQYKILIVDDDVETARMFGELLKYRGHNVTIFNEAIDSVGSCQSKIYDIIFMDFHMEKLNGVDAADIIKSYCCKNNSMIFAFTGDDSVNAIKEFKTVGMNGALIKPIDINLINKLMGMLEKNCTISEKLSKNFKKQLLFF